jgi:hypothetical protein
MEEGMGQESKTVAILKGQLSKFSGIISKRFTKPKQRLIKEILYGIQASKDIKLSNIARTLKEDQVRLRRNKGGGQVIEKLRRCRFHRRDQ